MKIKAGYRIEVSSWENDADNRQTKILDGLSEDQVVALVDYLNLYTRCGEFGNCYEAYGDWQCRHEEALWYVYNKHIDTWNNMLKIEEHDRTPDIFGDIVNDNIGYDLGVTSSSEFYTRRVDKISVVLIPKEVVFEDVTSKFI